MAQQVPEWSQRVPKWSSGVPKVSNVPFVTFVPSEKAWLSSFLSDPGKHGVRSMGPDVRPYKRFLKLN